MKKERCLMNMKMDKKKMILSGLLFLLFLLFTVLVDRFDVKPIGPEGSLVGFAGINRYILEIVGMHPFWNTVTNLCGIVSVLVALLFAMIGVFQLIRGKSIRSVDARIIRLGLFYVILLIFYILFECIVINHRPIMIEGSLEPSYPSSHVMLVMCIMLSAVIQVGTMYPEKKYLYAAVKMMAVLLTGITVWGRMLAGVHWFTDIVGALLISASMVVFYWALL